MSPAKGNVAEQSFHHSFLDAEVDDGLLLTIVYSGEFSLLGLLLHHLDLLDDLGREVLGCQLRVIQEESLAVDGDLADGLAVVNYAAIFGDFDSWKLLEKFFQHVVVGGLE